MGDEILYERIARVETKVDGLDKRLESIEKKLDAYNIHDRVKDLENDLKTAKKIGGFAMTILGGVVVTLLKRWLL